jgi:hypothetical protein
LRALLQANGFGFFHRSHEEMSRRNRLASVIAGQQREAWEYEWPPKFLIFDGDEQFHF